MGKVIVKSAKSTKVSSAKVAKVRKPADDRNVPAGPWGHRAGTFYAMVTNALLRSRDGLTMADMVSLTGRHDRYYNLVGPLVDAGYLTKNGAAWVCTAKGRKMAGKARTNGNVGKAD